MLVLIIYLTVVTKILEESNLRKDLFIYYFWLSLRIKPIVEGKCGGRSRRQLVTLHLQSGSREQWMLCSAIFPFFIQNSSTYSD